MRADTLYKTHISPVLTTSRPQVRLIQTYVKDEPYYFLREYAGLLPPLFLSYCPFVWRGLVSVFLCACLLLCVCLSVWQSFCLSRSPSAPPPPLPPSPLPLFTVSITRMLSLSASFLPFRYSRSLTHISSLSLSPILALSHVCSLSLSAFLSPFFLFTLSHQRYYSSVVSLITRMLSLCLTLPFLLLSVHALYHTYALSLFLSLSTSLSLFFLFTVSEILQ